jgi:hypothetical protein
LLPGGPQNGTVVNYDQLKEIEALTLKRQADFTAMLINGSFTAGEQAKFEFPAAGDYWVCGLWNVLAFDTVLANYSPWIGASGVDVGYILEAKGASSSCWRCAMPWPLPCPRGDGDCFANSLVCG